MENMKYQIFEYWKELSSTWQLCKHKDLSFQAGLSEYSDRLKAIRLMKIVVMRDQAERAKE